MKDLEKLRFVDNADVYRRGELVASLNRDATGVVAFSYLSNYRGPAIATTLPVGSEPKVTAGGSLPPFFSGLLPEGHRLSVLKNAVKTSFDDELSLLLAVGADLPGDIQVFPHKTNPTRASAGIDVSDTSVNFREIVDLVDLVGIAGVQNKTSASMVNALVTHKGHDGILKIDPPEHPHLVQNEFCT